MLAVVSESNLIVGHKTLLAIAILHGTHIS